MRYFLTLWMDSPFLKQVISIAVPIFIANIINSSLQLTDQLMLSFLGTSTFAAVGFVNGVYFIFIVIFFAISASSAVFFSRLWKQNKMDKLKEVQAIAILICLGVSFIILAVSVLFPSKIIHLYTKDEQVIPQAIIFFKNLAYTQPFLAISYIYIYLLRVANFSKVATKGSILSFLTNTVLNYILIFGHFGFAPMGILGASIATNISRIVLFGYIIFNVRKKIPQAVVKWENFLQISPILFKTVFFASVTLILSDSIWAFSMNIYTSLFGHLSTQAGAAYSVTMMLRQFFMIFIFSLSPACMILIGFETAKTLSLEAETLTKIKTMALRFLSLGVFISSVAGIFLLITLPFLLGHFYSHLDKQVKDYIHMMAIFLACFLPIMATNNLFGAGIFRAGGDFKSNLLFIVISQLIFSTLLGFYAYTHFKTPSIMLLFIYMGDALRLILNTLHFRKNNWLKLKTL